MPKDLYILYIVLHFSLLSFFYLALYISMNFTYLLLFFFGMNRSKIYSSDRKSEREANGSFLTISNPITFSIDLLNQVVHFFVQDKPKKEIMFKLVFFHVFVSEVKSESLGGLLVVILGILLSHMIIDPRCFSYFKLLFSSHLEQFNSNISSLEIKPSLNL